MSRDLKLLDEEFGSLVRELLDNCAEKGVTMTPYSTLRDVKAQARLWRRGRPGWVIKAKIIELRDVGAGYLADAIEQVGPQMGSQRVTNAIPGLSWHNWGSAVDCYRNISGKASWKEDHYDTYAIQAMYLGLTPGHFWTNNDSPHVQLHPESSPLFDMSMSEISREMQDRFDKKRYLP